MTPEQIDAVLVVPAECEGRRTEFAEAVAAALDIVDGFAQQYGWSVHMREPYFHGVEIYATRKELWRRVLEIHQLSDIPPPTDALTAALENEILLAVVPEEAERARPEYFHDRRDWTRALAHEIVHRLHVRILNGNEEAMGPEWFYEGFAVFGSGQLLGKEIEVTDVERAIHLAGSGGRGAYARYAAALRFFVEKVGLPELVVQAGKEDFEGWLRVKSKV